jgi:hypothetical protein
MTAVEMSNSFGAQHLALAELGKNGLRLHPFHTASETLMSFSFGSE